MLRACLIVDLHDCLAIVDRVPLTVRNFAARVVCLRKNRGEFYRCGTELTRIDSVVYERSPKSNGAPRIACGGSECRKVACKHCRSRNETADVGRILANRGALITAKEEEFVLYYRATNGTAELISLQRAVLFIPGRRIYSREIRCRIK